ncbi:MAG: acetyltransferase domain protein [Paenibacillus sp.]|jgi:hypothetical protein|nr:acetyltransferase domain protein [Paenibacillus sp.]
MDLDLKIVQVTAIEPILNEVSELLIGVVEDGASIGFLPPLQRADAEAYWRGVL